MLLSDGHGDSHSPHALRSKTLLLCVLNKRSLSTKIKLLNPQKGSRFLTNNLVCNTSFVSRCRTSLSLFDEPSTERSRFFCSSTVSPAVLSTQINCLATSIAGWDPSPRSQPGGPDFLQTQSKPWKAGLSWRPQRSSSSGRATGWTWTHSYRLWWSQQPGWLCPTSLSIMSGKPAAVPLVRWLAAEIGGCVWLPDKGNLRVMTAERWGWVAVDAFTWVETWSSQAAH